jgi:hypothetical protein
MSGLGVTADIGRRWGLDGAVENDPKRTKGPPRSAMSLPARAGFPARCAAPTVASVPSLAMSLFSQLSCDQLLANLLAHFFSDFG